MCTANQVAETRKEIFRSGANRVLPPQPKKTPPNGWCFLSFACEASVYRRANCPSKVVKRLLAKRRQLIFTKNGKIIKII